MTAARYGMARKIQPGEYQIGIWNVSRDGQRWRAVATGPGTLGDGSPMHFLTLAAAHLALTGEPARDTPRKTRQEKPPKPQLDRVNPESFVAIAVKAAQMGLTISPGTPVMLNKRGRDALGVSDDICQCSRCGRLHKSLQAGTPPAIIRQALSDRELAAVLAGLRIIQGRPSHLPPGIEDVYTDGGRIKGLDAYEIDALCERLNTGERP